METPRQVSANCSENGRVSHHLKLPRNYFCQQFLDAGLRDFAFESGVIAEGLVDRVLNGQQFNRVVRLHKLLHETLKVAQSDF